MNRLGLKIGCGVAAVVIWIQVASTTVVEADLALPVTVVNLPDDLMLVDGEVPSQWEVRLRATKLRVIAHKYLGRSVGTVQVDLRGREAGDSFVYEITPADVRTDQEVIAIQSPARLSLRLDRERQVRLPVAPSLVGRLPAGKLFLRSPQVRPDSVIVVGPRSALDGVRVLRTAPMVLDEVHESRTLTVAVVAPSPGLQLQTSTVEVGLLVSDLTERVVADVPVRVEGFDRAAVSPAVCDVTLAGPTDSLRSLVAADLHVTVVADATTQDVQHVRATVRHPDWVARATVEPEVFLVIVGPQASEQRR